MANLGTTLNAGQQLNVNDQLTASNGIDYLIMQGDGNLVLYTKFGQPIWDTKTYGKPTTPDHAAMQGDGNFVVYDAAGKPYWDSFLCQTTLPVVALSAQRLPPQSGK